MATSGVIRTCSRVFRICSRVLRICSRVFRICSSVYDYILCSPLRIYQSFSLYISNSPLLTTYKYIWNIRVRQFTSVSRVGGKPCHTKKKKTNLFNQIYPILASLKVLITYSKLPKQNIMRLAESL